MMSWWQVDTTIKKVGLVHDVMMSRRQKLTGGHATTEM